MKIIRFQYDHHVSYGRLDGEIIRIFRNSPFDELILEENIFKSDVLTIRDVKLLAPCQPTKIVCVGINYRSHATEFQHKIPEQPLLFMKPPSAAVGPDENIVLPPNAERIDYECELAVVIGRKAKNVAEKDFANYVMGYSCLNDVTDRVAQARDGQWTRAKGYDTFAPFGPWIDTEISPSNLKVETILNDKIMQSGNTVDLIFNVPRLVSFISSIMTLMPGDVIATGTPDGVGPMKAGDTVDIHIDGIGTLRNHVMAAST